MYLSKTKRCAIRQFVCLYLFFVCLSVCLFCFLFVFVLFVFLFFYGFRRHLGLSGKHNCVFLPDFGPLNSARICGTRFWQRVSLKCIYPIIIMLFEYGEKNQAITVVNEISELHAASSQNKQIASKLQAISWDSAVCFNDSLPKPMRWSNFRSGKNDVNDFR